MPTPKSATQASKTRPMRWLTGFHVRNSATTAGADAGRGAEPTEPDRVDIQAVLGDGGQQRDRTAEEDREEVE